MNTLRLGLQRWVFEKGIEAHEYGVVAM